MMFVIESYVSAGPLEFGMGYEEVKSTLGEPVSQEKSRLGDMILRYDGFGATVADGGVVEAYFLPGTEVSVSSVEVYDDAQAFRKLCVLDGAPKEFLGFIILLKLGITLTGFHDGDESQKAITAFTRGRWDRLSGEMKNYAP
jgi:hypothetical protein